MQYEEMSGGMKELWIMQVNGQDVKDAAVLSHPFYLKCLIDLLLNTITY